MKRYLNSRTFIRIASVLLLVHLLGHCVGHFTWDTPEDPKMGEVVMAMKSYKADFMGAKKSMADYYKGYSLMIFGIFAMTIAVLWPLSNLTGDHSNLVNKILIPIGITYTAFGIIEFSFFFPFAATMSLLAGMLILLSLSSKKR